MHVKQSFLCFLFKSSKMEIWNIHDIFECLSTSSSCFSEVPSGLLPLLQRRTNQLSVTFMIREVFIIVIDVSRVNSCSVIRDKHT